MDDGLALLSIAVLIGIFILGVFSLYKFFTLAPEWAVWSGIAGLCFGFIGTVIKE